MENKFYAGLDQDIKEILLKQIRNLWTHTSTAIEGNSLTLGDTEFILEEGLTVAGKPIRDHQDVIGHAKAIEIVYQLIEKNCIAEEDVFSLHRVMLIDPVLDVYRPVGAWKAEDNFTNYIDQQGKQKWRQYPSARKTPALMAEWLEKFNQALQQTLSRDAALMTYADLHLDFVSIHPFFDGNGRMARLLCNIPVLRAGFLPLLCRRPIGSGIKKPFQTTRALSRILSGFRACKAFHVMRRGRCLLSFVVITGRKPWSFWITRMQFKVGAEVA